MLSYVGNKGTNDKGFIKVVTEPQFLIHLMNIFFCFLGLFFNELCYSVLVSNCVLGIICFYHYQIFIILAISHRNEWWGPSPRSSAWTTQLRKSMAVIASRWRHCLIWPAWELSLGSSALIFNDDWPALLWLSCILWCHNLFSFSISFTMKRLYWTWFEAWLAMCARYFLLQCWLSYSSICSGEHECEAAAIRSTQICNVYCDILSYGENVAITWQLNSSFFLPSEYNKYGTKITKEEKQVAFFC